MSAPPSPAAQLRPVEPADLAFLWAMLGAAASPDGDPVAEADLRSTPELARYLDGWGRAGDAGLVAEDPLGSPIGACWYRRFRTDEPGYGFVDPATPELAIACVPAARGRGLGHQLMRAILATAARSGHARLSLSVLKSNAAGRKVYEDCGFRTVREGPDGDDLVMVAAT